MKVFFHDAFFDVYTSDPAATSGRTEAIVRAIEDETTFFEPRPADESVIGLVHI
ncbi:MAG: hypothetical protein JRH15_14750 [Deltaproteobacteria bacterium]|nr:hypothetical protein [Deltaproteobacteria bacterium]